jgi:hypothetical protein
MKQTAAVGRDVLVVTRAQAEEVAELIVSSTESRRSPEFLEAAHTSDTAFHAPMVLLQPVVLICACSVFDVAA